MTRLLCLKAADMMDKTPAVELRLMLDGTVDGYESYESAVEAQSPEPLDEQRIAGMDMLYSSGTTGMPKGITRAFPNEPLELWNNGVTGLCQLLFGVDDTKRYLSPAPFYHAAPLRFCMAQHALGATIVAMENFDAERYLQLVDEYDITHSQVVPTMFVRMLKLDEETCNKYDVSSLKCAIHAAAPCPIPTKEAMIGWWGPIVWEYYAGTEGMGMTLVNSAEWLAHKGTVGRAVVGTVKICDDEGNELPTGQSGTVYFADGRPFAYHNDQKKTAESRHPKGWSTLGDVGYLDADGFLHLTDRKAFMIISGGVNIYPQECENLLINHPKVMDCAVFGVPNADFGEEVKAVIQPMPGVDPGPALAEELIAFCGQHLARQKVPRSIDFEAELPRLPTGKLYKRLLKDEYWKAAGRSI